MTHKVILKGNRASSAMLVSLRTSKRRRFSSMRFAPPVRRDLRTLRLRRVAITPGLSRALDDLRPGDTIVVWRLDRLGRSLRDLLDISETLRERDVALRSLTDHIGRLQRFRPCRFARRRKCSSAARAQATSRACCASAAQRCIVL